MFTARSEYRLTVRAENADARLTPLADKLGLITEEQADAFRQKEELRLKGSSFLFQYSLPSYRWHERGVTSASPIKTNPVSAFKLLGYPGVTVDLVKKAIEIGVTESKN